MVSIRKETSPKATETHTWDPITGHVPTYINRPGKSCNQEQKTHKGVLKDKAILETHGTSHIPSVRGSFSGQSWYQLLVSDTGMNIHFG